MSKKNKEVKALHAELSKPEFEPEVPESMTVEGEEVELQTKKKYLKQAEKLVRRMDNILSDVHNTSEDVHELFEGIVTTECSPRDMSRINEMEEVLTSIEHILFQMVNRMARKYVGKEVESVSAFSPQFRQGKRKSLKK